MKPRQLLDGRLPRNLSAGTLKIDVKRYIQDLLKSKEMTSCQAIVFPMEACCTLFLNQLRNHEKSNITAYQCLVSKLIYLNNGTWIDIAFLIGQLSQDNSDLCARHLRMAKQVLGYLKGRISLDIQRERNLTGHRSDGRYGKLRTLEYIDNNYAGDIKDWKSITKYCFFFGRVIVTWCSK